MHSSKKLFVSVSLTLMIFLESFFILRDGLSAAGNGIEGHVHISEVKIAGKAAGGEIDAHDEFVELYNSGDDDIDLAGCALKRVTEAGKEYSLLSDLGAVIPARGYLLITPRDSDCADGRCYLGEVAADKNYSTKSFLSENNEVILYDGAGDVIDGVGWGNVANVSGRVFAGSFSAGESIERRLVAGKVEVRDFYLQIAPSPQNSGGEKEAGGTVLTDDVETEIGKDVDDAPADGAEEAVTEDDGVPSAPSSREKKIVVSELLINPAGDDGALEFVELYNAGSGTVDLSGWSLTDQAGKTLEYDLPSGTSVGAHAYVVFYSEETDLSLNNSGDGIVLADEKGYRIDVSPVSGKAAEGIAYALDENGDWGWTTSATPRSANVIEAPEAEDDGDDSVAEKNVVDSQDIDGGEALDDEPIADAETEYDLSDNVLINEIFPNPPGRDNRDGSYEWVELHNENEFDVNLRGWFLDDAVDRGSKPFRFTEDRIIPAGGYLVVSSEESKLALNNTEEEVSLLWPDRKVEDSLSYDKAAEDEAYALSPDEVWFWTEKKTPRAENARADAKSKSGKSVSSKKTAYLNSDDFTETEADETDTGEVLGASRGDYESVSVFAAKKLPAGTQTVLDGIVSAPPVVFGANIFYLADATVGDGIQIFSYRGGLPALALGDRIRIFGLMSEAGGEQRLVLDENIPIEKTSSNNLLKIPSVTCAEVGEGSSGGLIRIEGVVAERADDRMFFLIDSGGKRAKVYAKPESGILFDNLGNGDRVAVTGIVSRTSAGYRLLPRFSTDVHFLDGESGGIIKMDSPDSGRIASLPWASILLFLGLLMLSDRIRMRKRAKREAVH